MRGARRRKALVCASRLRDNRTMLRRYVATGRGEPFAILAVLGAALAGGVAVGIVEGIVDRWFSLVILFPLLIGATAGGLASLMIGRFRLRAPALAFALAAAAATAGYVATHVIGYFEFRSDIATLAKAEQPAMTDDEFAAMFEAELIAETGASGFRGYLELAAKHGVRLKRASSSTDDGIELTGIGAWLLWLAELAFAAGIAGFLAGKRAREPFCEACNIWFGLEKPIGSGSDGSKDARKQLMAALDSHDVVAAASVLALPEGPKAHFDVIATSCPQCGTDAFCTLKRMVPKKGAKATATLETWLMTRDELAGFADALARSRAQPPR
jgi:hypothetical protein